MSQDTKVAIVTGANRGIGLEVVHQLAQRGMHVVLGARDLEKGEEAAQLLMRERGTVFPHQLDVTDQQSIDRLLADVTIQFGHLDVLVNNAAILYDTWQRGSTADLETVQKALDTNLFGAWRMCETFLPLLRSSRAGRIVNVSSEGGSLASMGGGTPAYSVSKASLNAMTRILAAEQRGSGVLINAICPGWVATEMGGAGGRPVAEGAAGIIWAATLPDNGPTGGFFRDRKPLPW
jgi:NAD(P)-dependent dehydrogenase (short-subunit alcohol dehydrogenase family)